MAPSLLAFTERLDGALARQPGVLAVGVATNVPLSGNSNKSAATVKGQVADAGRIAARHLLLQRRRRLFRRARLLAA